MEIHYFSGTANTKLLAEDLAEKLSCRLKPLGLIESRDFIIMHPIYALGTPKHVLEWVKHLKADQGKVYIIKTAGDFLKINSQASINVIKILEKKGCEVVYDRVIVMPSNILFKFPNQVSSQLYQVAKHKINLVYKDIVTGIRRREKFRPFSQYLARLVCYMESKYGTKAFARSLKVNQACTNCGLCIEACPVKNIYLEETIKFGNRCVFCMKCVYNCPSHAIYSKSLNFLVLDSYSVDEFKDVKTSQLVFKGYFKHYIKYMNDDSL